MTQALANSKAAPDLTMDANYQAGDKTEIEHVRIKRGQGCAGTVGEGGVGSWDFVVIGGAAYVRPDAQLWKTHLAAMRKANMAAVRQAQAIAAQGKYLTGTALGLLTAGEGGRGGPCDLAVWWSLAVASDPSLTAAKGAFTTIDGARVLTLKLSDGVVDYVTDTSTPEITGFTNPLPGTVPAKLTFSYAPVTLTAPSPSQVADGSKLGF